MIKPIITIKHFLKKKFFIYIKFCSIEIILTSCFINIYLFNLCKNKPQKFTFTKTLSLGVSGQRTLGEKSPDLKKASSS